MPQDAYAEPGQDSRNIAGMEIVVIVQDVQDQPPVFTSAPPVTKLPPGILPGDKVSYYISLLKLYLFNDVLTIRRYYKSMPRMATRGIPEKFAMVWFRKTIHSLRFLI